MAPAMHTAGIYADMTVDGPEIGTLVVVVDRAKNLPNRRTMGKQDPYCAARLGKEAKKTETDRRGGQVPRWDQELRFTVHDSPDYYKLKVSVFNEDKRTDLIGEAWVNLADVLLPGGGQSDLWHGLECKGKYAGEIRIELTYYDTRPRAEKAVESVKSRNRAVENEAGKDAPARTAGPRELSSVKRRPLPTPTHSSPAQMITTASHPATPVPTTGLRSYHTPPHNSQHSTAGDNYSSLQDVHRSYSLPEPPSHERPLPDLHHSNTTSPAVYNSPDYQVRHHQSYEDQQRQQRQPRYTPDPYTIQFTPHENFASASFETPAPLPRHDRVHALNGSNPPKLAHSNSSPPALVTEDRGDSGHGYRAYPEDELNSSPLSMSYQQMSLSQSPPHFDPAFQSREPEQEYLPDTFSHSMHEPRHNSAPLPPPPPAHRFSAPPESREIYQKPDFYSVPQYNQRSFEQAPERFQYASSQDKHASGFQQIPEYGINNARPNHYGPQHGRYMTQPDPNQHSYNRRHSEISPPPVVSRNGYDLRTSAHQDDYRQRHDQVSDEPDSVKVNQRRNSELDMQYNQTPEPRYSQASLPTRGRHQRPQSTIEPGTAHNIYYNSVPLVRPRAISPGAASRPQLSERTPLPRKAVSQEVTPGPQAPSAPAIPFSPDSYDAFNPRASRSPIGNSDSPSSIYTSKSPAGSSPAAAHTADGRIITPNGREVDPSDHLPADSWAPEPDRKDATAKGNVPATAKARLGPREANVSSRTRLQNKQAASMPLSPTSANVLNTAAISHVTPLHNSPYPPPIPAKIPLPRTGSGVEDYEPGGDMSALSQELMGIDIGTAGKSGILGFGGRGGRMRRSQYGA